MHKSTSKNGFAVFIINLDETYSRVQWDLLEGGGERDFAFFILPFSSSCEVLNQIMYLLNGSRLESFKPIKGDLVWKNYLFTFRSW